jgi:hypothetical protein
MTALTYRGPSTESPTTPLGAVYRSISLASHQRLPSWLSIPPSSISIAGRSFVSAR